MDIYKKRRIFLTVSAAVLFFMIISILFSCKADKRAKERETAEKIPEITASEESGISASVSSVTQKETKPPVTGYTSRDRLNFADTDFIPDDNMYINPEYLNELVVVGDSIAKGYGVYKRLPQDSVLAAGSIGIRNVMETTFDYRSEKKYLTDILEESKPKYIFISLGMNDIHVLKVEEYAEKYKEVISDIIKKTPDSKIIVMSVTPVSENNEFAKNSDIDVYNESLRKMVYEMHSDSVFYLDAAESLKDQNNNLQNDLSSGDGIHLAGAAYDTLLSYMLIMLEWI